MKSASQLALSWALLGLVSSQSLAEDIAPLEIPSSLISFGHSHYYSPHALVVNKKNRTISVWENKSGQIIKLAEYPSDFGKNAGTKLASGDARTPEGIYFLEKMMEGKSLDFKQYGVRAFTTNYPNLFDQRAGKTGDGIWLHAIPDTLTLERGSRGCVVVRNKTIQDLSPYIKLGSTPIIIHNDLKVVPTSQVQKRATEISTLLEGWRRAWETKSMDSYIEYYGDEFNSMNMDRQQWKDFKQNLAKKYENIKVQLSQPMIFEFEDQIIVRQLQKYRSDMHEDFGEKTLYLKSKDGRMQIVAEYWTEVRDAEAVREVEEADSRISSSMVPQNQNTNQNKN